MPINPSWSFSPTVPGISGAAGAGTAGLGAAGLSFSSILPYLPIVLSVLGELFTKEKNPIEEALDLQRQMSALGIKQPYQSQYPKQLDPVVARALLAQLKRTSNWGWPAGMGMDTSFIEEALKRLGAGGLPGKIRSIDGQGINSVIPSSSISRRMLGG